MDQLLAAERTPVPDPSTSSAHPAVPDAPRPPSPVDPWRYPIGVAPLAVAPELVGRRWAPRSRRRIATAVAATGAMALLPFAGPSAHARERDRHELRVAAAELHLRAVAHDRELARRPAPLAQTGRESVAAGGAREAAPTPDRSAQPADPTPIAAVSGIRLVVPSVDAELVGFHEAAMPGSLAMASVAPLDDNHNPGPMPEVEALQEDQVAPAVVLPSRARAQGPSTAIDVAVPEGKAITAPVDGTVTAVLPYTLYGEHPDVRVEIQPEGRPDLRVIMIHVSDVAVGVGDRLEAGQTRVAGTATTFPFESQIDRFVAAETGRPAPHVHLEVKAVG